MTDLEMLLWFLVVCVVLGGFLTGLLKYYEHKELMARLERKSARRFDLTD